MRRFSINVALVLTLFAVVVAPAATAATVTYTDYTFNVPAKTPKTEVLCAGCSPADKNKPSVGYQGAIAAYVGRYVDSAFDSEGFSQPRPLRAWQMKYDAIHDRLYMRQGSYLAVYTLTNLINRLNNGESLQKLDRPSDVTPSGRYLQWDAAFNVEDSWPGGRWDGGDWLPDFDYDDRGYIYIAGGIVWGLVKDNFTGGVTPGEPQAGDSVKAIAAVKTADGRYFAITSPESGTSNVYDVTSPNAPIKGTTLNFPILKTWVSKSADNHWVALINGNTNQFQIYTSDALIAGRPPVFSTTTPFRGVTTDGTNFYAAEYTLGRLSLSMFTPSGNTFLETKMPTGDGFNPDRLTYGNGYLSVVGINSFNGLQAQDVKVFRVGSGTVTELDLLAYIKNSTTVAPYFASYASTTAIPSGYVKPSYGLMFDSYVAKKNGRTYLVINAKGLGEVYEIKGSDTITIQNKGILGTAGPSGTTPYYGDKFLFGSSTSALSALNVTWNFGNPESTDNSSAGTTGADVTHQFSGLTSAAQLPAVRTVTLTSSTDSLINDSLPVTLSLPAAHVGIVGQSNTSAIVTSDQWKDSSDGTVEGHYDSWNIDGTVTKGISTETIPVGDCAQHTLNFTANYGPYTGSGSTLASTNGAVPISLPAITYTPKPFIAIVNAPTSANNTVTFTSGSRATTDTAVLPAGTSFTWQWDLLDSGGTSLQTATGTSTINAVPAFNVPSATFTGKTGVKARLQLTTTARMPGNCANATSSTGLSAPQSAPDPQVSIVSGTCQYVGLPCTVKVTSASNADTSAWNVTWSFNPNSVAGGSGLTFQPSFAATYSGTLTASVTNAIGSGSASTTMSIAPAPCGTAPTQGDIALQYSGTSGTCMIGGTCSVNEKITFAATSFTYKFNSSCDQYLWDFGDGSTSTSLRATHQYTGNNQTYSGSFKITVGTTTITNNFQVKVGTTGNNGGGGGGGGGNSCQALTADSAFIFYMASSGCSYANPSAPCAPGEIVTLQVAPNTFSGYNFGCGTHSFTWNFGDGTTGSGQSITHVFNSGGTYNVSAVVNNPVSSMSYLVTIPISGASVCVTPTVNNTVITMQGSTSGCSAANPNCRTGENIGFNVAGLNGYSFDACSHTFTWDFGDGQTGTGQSTSHTYGDTQQHTAKVTITNQLGSVQLSQLVKLTSNPGSCPAPAATNAFVTYAASGGSNCSYQTPDVPCGANEAITFSANADSSTGYRFSCGTHTFLWNFDDGSTSTDRVPTHTFTSRRTYHVTCTITNSSGTVTLPLSVPIGEGSQGGGGSATVNFTSELVTGTTTLMKFTPSVTPANAVTSWQWNFGDGSDPVTITGTSTVPQYHPYANTGTYTVTLTTNAGVVTKQVIVGTPPPPRNRPGRH